MSDVSQVQSEERPCPVCGVMTEPEVDGEFRYWECTNEECDTPGYSWGFMRIEGNRVEGNCQLGVPESLRKAASAPMEQAQGPVFSIGRRS